MSNDGPQWNLGQMQVGQDMQDEIERGKDDSLSFGFIAVLVLLLLIVPILIDIWDKLISFF